MSESYDIPDDLYYTKDHEWVRIERKRGVVGITDYAQKKLREIIYVELPNVNTKVKQKETIATIESVKATSDIYSPISGKIVEVNIRLADNPELINESPYEDGWIAKIELSDEKELDNLMDPDEYRRYIESLEEEE
ncbi:MAG TPA: glycine cleavage system protein GcvH [Candidatus Caldiarchaeum subterraneum]|uniref:Probable glycine cleavage system H protein n=1 Tax=Caldiarchaeum subterraneum TaxID=311458 RepID=A0A832ZW50_CALS0|nr:glycine cleavage system protein GcvH [Aigarchaeota archaeon]HIQ29980.1 glycine cleavage system protein GcvH [Candidatus Caldarchaeum subterraneum]